MSDPDAPATGPEGPPPSGLAALSETDRADLRAFWLGAPLSEELARLMTARAERLEDVQRQRLLREYLRGLPVGMTRQARRMVLTYAPTAVARLVELMRDDSAETCRKAAVDLLRKYDDFARDELADAALEAAAEDSRLAESLTDDQVSDLLAMLADAQGRAGRGMSILPMRATGVSPVEDA